MEKILPISLKLNFTPNTVGLYGLKYVFTRAKLFVRCLKKRIVQFLEMKSHSWF